VKEGPTTTFYVRTTLLFLWTNKYVAGDKMGLLNAEVSTGK
jgi:hypothetical protein